MFKSIKPYGVVFAVLLLAACQTINKEERLAYDKLPAVTVDKNSEMVQLKTRPYVLLEYRRQQLAQAKAVAIYFPGGNGKTGNLFFENALPAMGIDFIEFDPPSDKPDGYIVGGGRDSKEHVIDVEAMIRQIRKGTTLPIWLIGHSMGTVSVANVATRQPNLIDGAVLLSAVTETNRSGQRVYGESLVTEMPLGNIKVPLLVVAHREDACNSTPADNAQNIIHRANNSPVKKLRIVEGGSEGSNPCTGRSYHTFWGIRSEVHEYVANFILSNSKAQPSQ